jgi:hypothetical protein
MKNNSFDHIISLIGKFDAAIDGSMVVVGLNDQMINLISAHLDLYYQDDGYGFYTAQNRPNDLSSFCGIFA